MPQTDAPRIELDIDENTEKYLLRNPNIRRNLTGNIIFTNGDILFKVLSIKFGKIKTIDLIMQTSGVIALTILLTLSTATSFNPIFNMSSDFWKLLWILGFIISSIFFIISTIYYIFRRPKIEDIINDIEETALNKKLE